MSGPVYTERNYVNKAINMQVKSNILLSFCHHLRDHSYSNKQATDIFCNVLLVSREYVY